jgi:radical SAM superfamily enzyme YgiQ (UPF0313 family)
MATTFSSQKIILIKPFQPSNEIIPPLGLGYLASMIRHKYDIEIWDGILHRLTPRKLTKWIRKNPALVYGIQYYSADQPIVAIYSQIIRKIHPMATIVVGGPQPSALPRWVLNHHPEIDFAFIGEAEIGFAKLCDIIATKGHREAISISDMKDIPGLVYRVQHTVLHNPPIFLENLDQFDPCYDLLHLEQYPLAPHGAYCQQYPTAPIIISRGCPYNCQFCCATNLSGPKVRYHSVSFIIAQLIKLRKRFGIKEFHIEDDNFTVQKEYVEQLCTELQNLPYKFTWTAANGIRIDTLTDSLLNSMIKAGFYSASVGIETASEKIRNNMGKHLSNAILFEKIQLLQSKGLDIIGFFILGYPGESQQDIKRTISFACQLPLKRANFATFKPFPGTAIFKQLVQTKNINNFRWNKLVLHQISWVSNNISKFKLDILRREAWLRFYSRPKYIFNIIKNAKNAGNLWMILTRIFRLLIFFQ